ncbi:MAG: S8 family serine peptidase [Gemmatimonadetes bacterium]|nr:S8 family serine peptidase [Gemmatimonadota bacterium]
MRVSVPATSLLAVSGLPGVGFVRKPYRPHPLATISEGAARIGALANHGAGVTGHGVKVAVIDGGFRGADRLPEDMPESWRVRDFTGEGIYAGDEHRRHRHGTACAEIVYDVAPEAELYLLKVDDLVDLENAKDLCIREGIDVISHSAGWLGTGFGDGRGLACDIANDAADNGILWVNAAGNAAGSHYTGLWSDRDSDGWHNFADEDDDELLNVRAAAGDSIQVILTWDDFPSTAEDYNLHLFFIDASDSTDLVGESTTVQDGDGSDPVEWIKYIVERSGEYGISVSKADGARPERLKIWSYYQDFEEHAVARNSIGMPADAKGAMAVGAVFHRFWNRGLVEAYSSRGPTTDGRIKPELAAPTGVSTVSYGRLNLRRGGGYFGTSASAPHVAGAAALVKSANPSFSRTRLWNALVDATVDTGTRGKDNDSGHGKLVLPVQAPSPQITAVTPGRVRYHQIAAALGDPFPTPFNAGVTVPFTTADPGQVRISVFNLMGQQVRVLHDGWTGAGAHQARWDGRTETGAEAASGIYRALLEAGEIAQSTRLVLIR